MLKVMSNPVRELFVQLPPLGLRQRLLEQYHVGRTITSQAGQRGGKVIPS
jgi:hypothetical protein